MRIASIAIFCLFLFSCIKKDINSIENTKIASIELGKDIHFSEDTNINLNSAKIYKSSSNYYYGNFYFGDEDKIYYIDYPLFSLNEISENGIKNIISNSINLSNANIMDVDKDGIYIAHTTTAFREEEIVVPYTVYEDDPDSYESGAKTLYRTETNVIETKTAGLVKVSSEGKYILQVNSILDVNDNLLKIIHGADNFFIVHRSDKLYIDTYSMDGKFINSSSRLSELEKADDKKLLYSRIIDTVYNTDKNAILVLVENTENGKIINRKIYSYEKDIKEIYLYEANAEEILGMKSNGIIVSLGYDGSNYYLVRENIFNSERDISYIKSDNAKNMMLLNVFNNSVYSFNVHNNVLTFVKY